MRSLDKATSEAYRKMKRLNAEIGELKRKAAAAKKSLATAFGNAKHAVLDDGTEIRRIRVNCPEKTVSAYSFWRY